MEVRLRRLLREAPAGPDRQRRAPGAVGRRLAVVGTTGAGKTTLARAVSVRLGVPHVELDALFWRAGWVQSPPEEFRRAVLTELQREGWIVDGNYGGKLGSLVLEQAELVVWLDLPLRTTLARLLARTLARIRDGEELFGGNRESWRNAFLARDSILVWGIRTHRSRRRRYAALLAAYPHVRLGSAREVEEWLASLEPLEPE